MFNLLRSRQNGCQFPDDIFKCIFLTENAIIAIKISLKFVPKGSINNIPILVQIMAWRQQGDKPLSEPMMVRLSTYICVTRPQWVNSLWLRDQLVANGIKLQYIPRHMHTVFALLCFVVVIHWLIFPYPSGLLHWHCGNLTIAPVPAKQPWWIWRNTSCEFIMNDCTTTIKESTTKPCAYFLGYTVLHHQ